MNEFINKNRKALLITITVLLGITLTITFAYFANTIGDSANTNVDVTSQGTKSLVFNVEKTLSLVANTDNFADGDGSISDTAVASATLTKGSTEDTSTEDYYVYFQVNSNDYVYTTVDKKPEMILTIIDPDGNEVTTGVDGFTPVTVTDAHTNETITGYDITEFDDIIVIKSNYPISTTSTTKHDWTAKVTFVNLDTLQNENQLKTLDAEFVLSDEKPPVPLNEHIIELHNGVDGTNNIYYTNNSEYRYTGATPNNYVTFNDETWRIIGVFNENTHGQAGEQLVKIIRDETLGNYEWDVSNVNDWTISDMESLLNDYYYNSSTATTGLADCNGSLSGICSFEATGIKTECRGYIKEVTWKLGGHNTPEVTTSQMYGYERGLTVYNSSRPTEWSGKIGLMYPSDYGYASDASCYTTNLFDYQEGCDSSNWLSGITEWTITPHSSYSRYVWGMFHNGSVHYNDYYANNGYASRPVLYLTSGVKMVSGTGSEADPFQVKN